MQAPVIANALLKIEQARTLAAESTSGFYAKAARGLLPPPIKIGPRASAVPARELDAVLAARIAGHSDDQIKVLVAGLVAARAAV